MKLIDIFENKTDINDMSDEEQLAAVNRNGDAIRFIKNPSPEVQLAAVKQRGLAIEYIKNPSPEVQLAAVKKSGDAILLINNPSHELITLPSVIKIKDLYDSLIKNIYPNNNLLIKKWIRYGDTMREDL